MPSQVYLGSSRIRRTLLQFADGTLLVNSRFMKKIYEGYGFSVSHRFESVGSGSNIDVYFENPADSGREVFLIVIEVVSFAQAWVDIYRGNSITTSGTKITPVNLNFASNNSSVCNVEYGGTYSTGTRVHNTVCPGGSHIRAIGGAVEVGETVVIPEDFNFLIRVTNKSASTTDLSIRILWFEEPLT